MKKKIKIGLDTKEYLEQTLNGNTLAPSEYIATKLANIGVAHHKWAIQIATEKLEKDLAMLEGIGLVEKVNNAYKIRFDGWQGSTSDFKHWFHTHPCNPYGWVFKNGKIVGIICGKNWTSL